MDKLLEKLSAVPPKQRWGLLVLVVLAIVGGYWFLSWSDAYAKYEKQISVRASLEKQRAEKEAYVNNLADYEAKLSELQQELNRARNELPDKPDVAQLLAQLGNKARQSGLDIDRFEPKGEKAKGFYAEIVFSVQVHGSFHEISTFIDSLSQMDRIINVSDLTMTNPKTVNQKTVLESAFSLTTYRYVAEAGEK
jgi:type IV pilus assembly protein PilO